MRQDGAGNMNTELRTQLASLPMPPSAWESLATFLEEEPMAPILALLLQMLPQLLKSLLEKEAHAAKNGYTGPTALFTEGCQKAADCYARCVAEMAPHP